MKVKANLIQVLAPVFFLLVVVIDLGQDSESRCGATERRERDGVERMWQRILYFFSYEQLLCFWKTLLSFLT